jgi:hypothetical protein
MLFRRVPTPDGGKKIEVQSLETDREDALAAQLDVFVEAVRRRSGEGCRRHGRAGGRRAAHRAARDRRDARDRPPRMSTVLLSVGDASGDVYASDFVRELRARLPDTRFVGLGGAEMEKAGVELVVHQRDVAVSGLFELLPDLHRIVRAWQRMTARCARARPTWSCSSTRRASTSRSRAARARLGCPTLYYVSPQVWAWRTGRIRKLARWVNQLAVIFPFEPAVYAGTRVPVEYVGHPLVERLARVRERSTASARAASSGCPRTRGSWRCCRAAAAASCATCCRSSSRWRACCTRAIRGSTS